MAQSRPVDGTAASGHTNNGRPVRPQNTPFAPLMNDVGNVHQFSELYPLDYRQHDPSLDIGSSAAFFGLDLGDYRHGIAATGADTLNQFVQQQGNPLLPSWSPYAGTEFQQNLDISTIGHMYPIDNSVSVSATQTAPAYWNRAGTDVTSTSRSDCVSCDSCDRTFNCRREMKRHMATVHGDKKYVCGCSYSTARKDNYTRHLKDTCKVKDDAGRSFTCICGKTSDNFNSHLTHVQKCGIRRAGRPPQQR